MVEKLLSRTILKVDGLRQQPSRHRAEFHARQATHNAASGMNPADVEGAAQRLDRLLAHDGENGPRKDAPPRGYYLNIVV